MSKRKLVHNFVEANVSRRKKRRPWLKYTLLYGGILIGVMLIFFGTLFLLYKTPAQEVYSLSIQGKDSFLEAQQHIVDQDFDEAQVSLTTAIDSFENAHNTFSRFHWMSHIPWIGAQIKAVDNLMLAGINTGRSIETINQAAISIISPLEKDTDISLATLSDQETADLLMRIQDAKPDLEKAKVSIDQAVNEVNLIPENGLNKKIKQAAQPLREAVPQLQSAIDQAISASQIIPWVAGYPEERTYLFLLQNNTELRPTGGFIGTYGILKVKNGDIKSFETDNSYNLDEPVQDTLFESPPWPLTRYNAVQQWFFRDSNWAPDFPTTAEQTEWFYHKENGPEKTINGVIAVTPTFIQSLLELTGTITVDGVEFTVENFVDTLQYQVDQGFLRQGLEESQRKEIIGELSDILLDRVISLPQSQWSKLWEVFSRDIAEKQILIYVKNEIVQDYIAKENWGGAISETDSDYVSFFDANLASLKTDAVVNRELNYQVQRDGENLIADVSISYTNNGSITWKTTRYRTYTRVYVPEGSTLLKSEGAMVDCKLDDVGGVETLQEYHKTSFGAFICIEPGETKTLHYKYHLPKKIFDQYVQGTYSLVLQKQPGASNYPSSVSVDLGEQPREVVGLDIDSLITDTVISFSSVLSQDRMVEITYD